MALAVVRDLRAARAPAGPDELAAFETDTLAGLVLARAAAGLADSTIAGEVIHLEQVRAWLGRPLWTMQPCPCRKRHPYSSCRMLVLMEHPTEPVVSSYVKARDLVRRHQRRGQWLERAGVRDALMRPVPVVELLELPQGA